MIILTVLSLIFGSVTSFAKYDEVRDESGRLRPNYQPLSRYFKTAKDKDRRAFQKHSLEAFAGDNALSPIPRMMNFKEFSFLQKAVDQRARALRAFLQDHYGAQKYRSAGIIPDAVVNRAITRAGEVGYQGQINPANIAFIYGPDIVRAELDGKLGWFVLEDNTGYVGGFGDLILAHELILDLHPTLSQTMKLNDPMNFYQQLARDMRQKALENGGIAVLFRSGGASDTEGERVEKILGSLGIYIVSPESNSKLEMDEGVPYVTSKKSGETKERRKVGFVFLEDELSWVDHSNPATNAKYIHDLALLFLDPGAGDKADQDRVRTLLADVSKRTGQPNLREIRKILVQAGFLAAVDPSPVPGLIESAMKGRVAFSNSPGTDFVGDKEIYLYTENFISYYLGEKPLLRTVPSQPFADESGTLRAEIFADVFNNLEKYVIKRFDGRGGSSVWIGKKLKPKEIRELKSQIEADPSSYKAQTRLEISRMEDQIGDIRPLSHVDNQRILIADTPWGRGAPASGSGKVNISSKGHEVTVIVGERCEDRLR